MKQKKKNKEQMNSSFRYQNIHPKYKCLNPHLIE